MAFKNEFYTVPFCSTTLKEKAGNLGQKKVIKYNTNICVLYRPSIFVKKIFICTGGAIIVFPAPHRQPENRCHPEGRLSNRPLWRGARRSRFKRSQYANTYTYPHTAEVINRLFTFTGSGKKALLDVISRRVQGPTRGQILLNNQPMSLSLFQQRCGYVTHKCDLIPGLTVEQTLYYTPTKVRKVTVF